MLEIFWILKYDTKFSDHSDKYWFINERDLHELLERIATHLGTFPNVQPLPDGTIEDVIKPHMSKYSISNSTPQFSGAIRHRFRSRQISKDTRVDIQALQKCAQQQRFFKSHNFRRGLLFCWHKNHSWLIIFGISVQRQRARSVRHVAPDETLNSAAILRRPSRPQAETTTPSVGEFQERRGQCFGLDFGGGGRFGRWRSRLDYLLRRVPEFANEARPENGKNWSKEGWKNLHARDSWKRTPGTVLRNFALTMVENSCVIFLWVDFGCDDEQERHLEQQSFGVFQHRVDDVQRVSQDDSWKLHTDVPKSGVCSSTSDAKSFCGTEAK